MSKQGLKFLGGAFAALIFATGPAGCSDDKDSGGTTDGAVDGVVGGSDGAATDGSTPDAAAADTKVADAAVTDAAGADGAASDGAAGDASGDGAAMTKIASSTGTWEIYPATAPATNAAMNIKGTAEAFDIGGGKTKFVLNVTALPASTEFGAHLHKLACNDTMAGGHYQDMLPPDGGVPADVATATNEVWLDFTTSATGAATKEATVSWKPRAGQAKSIVVHAMKTGVGGAAGAKLACLNMPF